jgi:Outer membrane protein beta-barrel domain
MKTPVIIVAALTLCPIAARGQTPEPPPFRADTTAAIGWFTASHAESGNCCGDWSSSLFKGVGGGYYWTDHLKSEIEIGWPGPTRAFSYSSARPTTGPISSTYEEHAYRGVKISGSQLYQFGHNAMFHPFAGAGIDVDRERDAITRTIQQGNTFTRVDLSERETHVRPFVATGFKAYFSERAFFRTEVKVGFSRRVDQLVWKSGIGVDLGTSGRRGSRSEKSSHASPPARTNEPPAQAREPKTPRGRDAPELWRAYAAKLPIGSTVRVASAHSDAFVASLLGIDDTGVLLKPKTRIPEPARHISFDALETLELYAEGTAADHAGAIVAGVGSGAGAFFLLLLALVSQID